jgi:hypothetical protein
MKKLVLIITSLLFVSFLVSCTGKSSQKKIVRAVPSLNNITLNGLSRADAETMVSNFTQDNNSSVNSTNVWLSKKWVESVAALLAAEKQQNIPIPVDGFRIYFAKNGGENTIVIVSTKQDVPNPLSSSPISSYYHKDYYDHSSSPMLAAYLQTKDAIVQEDYSKDEGATLYYNPQCPTTQTCSINAYNFIYCDEANKAVMNFGLQPINIENEWFPVSLLFYLRDELDATAATADKITPDGIRIYFAKYPVYPTDPNQTHINRHGLIFVTTKQTADGDHQDYYQCYASNSNWKKTFTSTNDNGEECPNNCDDITLP